MKKEKNTKIIEIKSKQVLVLAEIKMELNTFGGLWSYASDLINSGYIVSRQVLNCSCY